VNASEVIEKLKDIELEDLEKRLREEDNRDMFDILLICTELQWDFYFQIWLSALETWLDAYNWEHQQGVKL
jgi:hypothetical protein